MWNGAQKFVFFLFPGNLHGGALISLPFQTPKQEIA